MMDKEMINLVHLGILKKDMQPYTTPIMLIARENSDLKKIITDFGIQIADFRGPA